MIAIAEAVDEDLDQLMYVATLIMSFMACLVMGQISSVPTRKIFSTTMGFLISWYFYGILVVYNIVYILGNYLFMKYLPRE